MRTNKTVRLDGYDLTYKMMNDELRNIAEFTITPNDNDFLEMFVTITAKENGYEKVFPATAINNYYDNTVRTDRVLITSFTTLDGITYKLDWKEVK